MLKKLTATAITAAGITGGILLGGPAHAATASPTVVNHCFGTLGYCSGYQYYQPSYFGGWNGGYGYYPYHRFFRIF